MSQLEGEPVGTRALAPLDPYPDYFDSESPELGRVPVHWRVQTFRSLARRTRGRNRPDLPLLSVVRERGVIPRASMMDEENHNFVPDDLSNYRAVSTGDFVINKMKAWQGSVGIAPMDGIVSPAYFVFSLAELNPEYAHLLLRSRPYVALFSRASDGVRIGQWDLSPSALRGVAVLIPPAPEQDAIVRYLDHADQRIQRAIRAKKRLIALLNEQKAAIIHRAVTRGLDPSVPMKPSGAEWLGDVPSHWDVLPLKRRWTVTDCKHLTVPFTDAGIPLASVREAQRFDLSLATAKRTTEDWYSLLVGGGRRPRQGDLIYCRNVSVGAATFVGTDERFAMGQDVCLIRSATQDQRYLNYFLHSPAMEHQLSALMVGSTFNRINVEEVKRLMVTAPPADEQSAISAYLDRATASQNQVADVVSGEISLLQEFRTRLISDVVTGKIDVRQAAANLPDVSGADDLASEEMNEDSADVAEELAV